MSIRQHRIDSPERIRSKMPDLKGRKITLVLADQTAVLGELVAVDTNDVTVKNGRLKKVRYSFTDIRELYFDQIV